MHEVRRKALGSSPLDELGIRDLLTSDGGGAPCVKDGEVVSTMVNVSEVKPNPYQPRKHFSATSLEQLSQSIKAQGLLQPVVVRKNSDGVYELIAGERRLRASQMAGLDKIPAVVKEISDQACLAFAIIENIQRQDLNAIEEAILNATSEESTSPEPRAPVRDSEISPTVCRLSSSGVTSLFVPLMTGAL